MQTPFDNYTDAELVLDVDNDPQATLRERALAERLDMRGRDIRDLNNELHSQQDDFK